MNIQPKKQEWRETSLKGRMAESLVYDLLKESGNEVFRIGYEAILPGLARIQESFKRNSEVGEKIRSIPDFFVIDKTGSPYLVEVKFRWDSKWHDNDYKMLWLLKNSWQEVIIAVVSCKEKPYFRFSKHPFGEMEPIKNLEQFCIFQELLDKFDVMVEKYFTPTLCTPKDDNTTNS
ncbi:MAG: hypothetical protein A3D41_03215 [Candidatus Sungbacteria bacterium RIFCSPHIGHO2_02_FULL_41_12b]|nr:MAG: hypothetical protein A3D41_03215 [Candidatus Sungbacteria bacterium RIFCSPHIGHO2_02_FULL_41_12b]